ncbi:MAG: 2,3-diaminopropionate biosynthesis protein SbnB [Blastocatellia bacterium]|nr:2,3-diaminopropionate biosynthesis protein SbnB [Blastocatellia bacterium]
MDPQNDSLLILTGSEVISLLEGREREIMETVKSAYETHGRGDSSLPQSVFLRFPGDHANRIIGLPTYLGGETKSAGIKWIASFPSNSGLGLERASAIVILNSVETGRPLAMMEGSIISAKRTAASAVLGAQYLLDGREVDEAGLVGCGPINFEIASFLLRVLPELRRLIVYDLDPARAEQFINKCRELPGHIEAVVAESVDWVLRRCSLISLATTATVPHIFDISMCWPASVILHISLRDLSPEIILSSDNVVDDIDHVCRANTSIHLAVQSAGNSDFIRCTLADILSGSAPARKDDSRIAIFSPFGLGVLDIALGKLIYDRAKSQGKGVVIDSFIPGSWLNRAH